MAIAFDATTSSGAGGSSQTWSHTCTGSNLLLVVQTYSRTGASSVSGITYNGVALAKIDALNSGGVILETWYLIAPATGAHNVVVTWVSTGANNSAMAYSYTGTRQSGVPDAHGTNTGTTSVSVALTTIADNCWIFAGADADVVQSGLTNLTLRNSTANYSGDTNGAQTPAGSHTVGMNFLGGTTAKMVALSFAPFAAAAANGNFLSFM